MATSSTGEIDFPVMKEAAPAMKSTGTIRSALPSREFHLAISPDPVESTSKE